MHSRFDLRDEQGHRPSGTAGSGNRDFCAEGGRHRTAVRRRSILLGGPSVHPAAGMSPSLNDTFFAVQNAEGVSIAKPSDKA
jgi:hypothetical protein